MDGSMKNVSFDNPFFDEISKYPVLFAKPVFFGESPYSSYAASLNNGTATLLRLKDKFLGVTCRHVVDGYRKSKALKHTIFQLGRVPIDLEMHLISEDRNHDLAVFDLTPFVGKADDLTEANFVQPTIWPPREVSEQDAVCFAGFPGIWREQKDLGYLRFYSFSSGASKVLSVGEDYIVTTIQLGKCITQITEGIILGSLGGLSGGPVFVWRTKPILIAELVGFMYEFHEKWDLMRVRAAKVIREDGSLA